MPLLLSRHVGQTFLHADYNPHSDNSQNFPFFHMEAKAMKRFVILCHARTGSNYVVNMLAQHPELTTHNELFSEDAIFHAQGIINDAAVMAQRDAQPIVYLQSFLSECQTPVFGFKHLLFNSDAIIEHVTKGDYSIIILER